MAKVRFPVYRQLDAADCGPTSLQMIAKYYGKHYPLEYLREQAHKTRSGVSLLGLSDLAESIGFQTLSVRVSYDKLKNELPLPCIAHWRQDHFIVVYKISKDTIYIADPAHGRLKYKKQEFLEGWRHSNNGKVEGILLLLEPREDFKKYKDDYEKIQNQTGFAFLASHLSKYKKYLLQLFFGLLVGSLIQLVFPILTQSLVDYGINNKNIGFIYTILFAQLMLSISRTSVDLIRSWILLHIGTRINIALISEFLHKLMQLPRKHPAVYTFFAQIPFRILDQC